MDNGSEIGKLPEKDNKRSGKHVLWEVAQDRGSRRWMTHIEEYSKEGLTNRNYKKRSLVHRGMH